MIGAFSRELDNRRPQDRGLTPRIVEVDRVGTRVSPQVVDAAQKIVGMRVQLVGSARGKDSGPAARDLDVVLTDSQESENSRDQVPHTGDEIAEFAELVKLLL